MKWYRAILLNNEILDFFGPGENAGEQLGCEETSGKHCLPENKNKGTCKTILKSALLNGTHH